MTESEMSSKRIEAQLMMDSRIDLNKLKVEINDGIVYLSGTVQSLAALNAVENAVRSIENVKKIYNKIKIRYDENNIVVSDQSIIENVKKILDLDRNIKAEFVKVEIDQGIVRLTGSVDSYWSKIRCQEIISGIAGVNQIINELDVVPTVSESDHQIAIHIHDSLQRMSIASMENITIEVKKGVVTITGKVPHWNAYNSVEFAVRHTRGVLDVKNELILA